MERISLQPGDTIIDYVGVPVMSVVAEGVYLPAPRRSDALRQRYDEGLSTALDHSLLSLLGSATERALANGRRLPEGVTVVPLGSDASLEVQAREKPVQ